MTDIERRFVSLETTITGRKLGGYAAVFDQRTDMVHTWNRLRQQRSAQRSRHRTWTCAGCSTTTRTSFWPAPPTGLYGCPPIRMVWNLN